VNFVSQRRRIRDDFNKHFERISGLWHEYQWLQIEGLLAALATGGTRQIPSPIMRSMQLWLERQTPTKTLESLADMINGDFDIESIRRTFSGVHARIRQMIPDPISRRSSMKIQLTNILQAVSAAISSHFTGSIE
jgi:hypothetical protein